MGDLRKGYWVHLLPCERPDGQLAIALIARRTYSIVEDAPTVVPLPDEEQPPILEQDRCDEGGSDKAPPTLELDLVPEKPKVDVLVLAKAYAPGGKAVPSFECAVQVGNRAERLKIWGPRKALWQPPRKENQKYVAQLPKVSDPEPIKELKLSYLHAYGGKSWVILDDEVQALARKVNAVLAEEGAEKQAAVAAKKAQAQKAAEAKAKEDKIKAVFADKDADAKEKAEKLKLGDGSEGFDDEGVRLWDKAASKDGTAVLSLEELDRQQLAEMAAKMRQDAENATEREREARKKKLKQNTDGEWVEVDDGAEVLTDAELAKAQSEAAQQAAADAEALAVASKKRSKEQVQQSDGTRVMDAMDDDGEDAWPADLRSELDEQDAAGKKAREKAEAARKKMQEEALKDFPQISCPTNPYGKGFCLSNQKILLQRLELPQIEHPDAPLTAKDLIRDVARLQEVPFAYGFGTVPRHAWPRVQFFGPPPSALANWDKTLQDYKRGLDLEDEEQVKIIRALDQTEKPKPIQPAFYNAASVQMQWPALRGDEAVTLTNLTKSGTLWFKLPGKALIGELDRGAGVERQDLTLDTLVIDVEEKQVTLLWRTQFALKSWQELGEYPHMVGWVLDLDVEQKKDLDYAERVKAARGEGTAILDISQLPVETEPYLPPKPQAPRVGEDGVLELPKEGSYLRADTDDQWVKDAGAGVHDLDAEEAERRAEAAYQAKKKKALESLAKMEQEEAERRKEVTDAIAAGKPVPPKGDANAAGQAKAKKPKK